MPDISVLRKELEKTGCLDQKVPGAYEYYLLEKKHMLILVDHPITVENRMNMLKQVFHDLCLGDKLPTWRDRLVGNSSNKNVIIVGRTTQSHAALSLLPRFRSVSLHPKNGNIVFGIRNSSGLPVLQFSSYLINEEQCKVVVRELGFLPLTMPKRIKAIDLAIRNYLQFLKQHRDS